MIEPTMLHPILPALFEALGTNGVAVVIVADRGNGFERWYSNQPAAAMLGYTVEELADLPMLDMVVPEQRSVVTQLSASLRGGHPIPPALELGAVHKDGSHILVELALGHARIDGGIAYAMILRAVGAAPQAQLSLLEADRIGLVGALAAGFAHEINNPLTSVMLNLRSLRKQLGASPGDAQVLRCLDDVTAGAERIASNVRALQTLAIRNSTHTIDVAAVVSSALRIAAPTLEPRAHVVRQIVPVRPVTGEESRIGQAVLAMMLFSSSGFDGEAPTANNQIIVAVEERAPDIVVEVSDNGHDLTADEIRSAFDPFFRSSARGAGVGVGLGVARSIAAGLGGEVTLAPRPGGGAVITMRLPAGERVGVGVGVEV